MSSAGSDKARRKTAPPATWGSLPRYGEFTIAKTSDGEPKLLGRGSFGKTYEAVRTDEVAGARIEEFVALKVLDPALLASEAKKRQFAQELLALTKFKHSNLIHYIRCGEQSGEVYYAMTLCRGGDLRSLVKRFGPIPEKAVALIGLQVATGLREMHEHHDLVHRDIKASNIMLVDEMPATPGSEQLATFFEKRDSLCRIVDFGLVAASLAGDSSSAEGRFAGSPMFASPEQVREQPLDGRTDIYSLGMTLWYLLQGKGPLLDASGSELRDHVEALRRHSFPDGHDTWFPPQISDAFRSVLSRMVAKNPEDRFGTAMELQAALRAYLAKSPKRPRIALPETTIPVTRLGGAFDSFFAHERSLPSRPGMRRSIVRSNSTGERFIFSTLPRGPTSHGPDDRPDELEVMSSLVGLSRDPALPPAILHVKEMISADDTAGVLEELPDGVELSEVLRARTASRQPVTLSEAAPMLRVLASSMDYLIRRGIVDIEIPCDTVWLLCQRPLQAISSKDALSLPLNAWPGLLPVFSMIRPRSPSHDFALDATLERTISGTAHASSPRSHAVGSFCRLLYRIVSGSEIPSAAEVIPSAYVPTGALGSASNNLIRDIVSHQVAEDRVSAVFARICTNEGVILSSSSSHGRPVRSVVTEIPKSSATSQSQKASSASEATLESIPSLQALSTPFRRDQKDSVAPRRTLALAAGAVVAVVLMGFFVARLFREPPSAVEARSSPGASASQPPVPAAPRLKVPDDYASISEALAAAKPGDTVFIRAGNYQESMNPLRLPDGVSIEGEEPGLVMISGRCESGSVLEVFDCLNRATISNISFRLDAPEIDKRSDSSPGQSFAQYGSSVVRVRHSNGVRFWSCSFVNGRRAGLEVYHSFEISAYACRFAENQGPGIAASLCDLDLARCSIENNKLGLEAEGQGCVISLRDSMVHRNKTVGVFADAKAVIVASHSSSHENGQDGVVVIGTESLIEWTGGEIANNGDSQSGCGVRVEWNGRFFGTEIAIRRNFNVGLLLLHPSAGTRLRECSVAQNQKGGLLCVLDRAGEDFQVIGGEVRRNGPIGISIHGRANDRQPIIKGVRIADHRSGKIGVSMIAGVGVRLSHDAVPIIEDCIFENNDKNIYPE